MTYTKQYPLNIVEGGTNVQQGFEKLTAEDQAIYDILNTVSPTVASGIVNTPYGNITATNVQDAINQLNTISSQIDTTQYVKNGELVLPSLFPSFPFKIYRDGYMKYSHKVTPDTQHDWSTATQIYISCTGGAYSGTSPTQPITLARFKTNQAGNVYPGVTDFVLNFLDAVYIYNSNTNIGDSLNYLLRSRNVSGETYFLYQSTNPSSSFNGLTWTAQDGIYTTTITDSSSQIIYNVVNLFRTDLYGMPFPYTKVASKALCQTTKGTFWVDTYTGTQWILWVNPYNEDPISNILPHHVTNPLTFSGFTGNVIMLENLSFTNNQDNTIFSPNSTNTEFYMFGCKGFRGLYNSQSFNGAYKLYLFDCVTAYSSNDGFNYHSTTRDSLVVEVNCISYSHGQYKIPGGNTTTHSNNCSTSHDGMHMLRVGGRYWDCEGPIVVDADDVFSISIGCQSYNVLNSTTGQRSGFYVYDTSGVTPINNKYFIECLVSGKNITTAYKGTGNNNTYYLNCMGIKTMSGVQRLDSWEDAV